MPSHGGIDEFSIVFPCESPQAFNEDDEEKDANDGSGESAFGLVVP